MENQSKGNVTNGYLRIRHQQVDAVNYTPKQLTLAINRLIQTSKYAELLDLLHQEDDCMDDIHRTTLLYQLSKRAKFDANIDIFQHVKQHALQIMHEISLTNTSAQTIGNCLLAIGNFAKAQQLTSWPAYHQAQIEGLFFHLQYTEWHGQHFANSLLGLADLAKVGLLHPLSSTTLRIIENTLVTFSQQNVLAKEIAITLLSLGHLTKSQHITQWQARTQQAIKLCLTQLTRHQLSATDIAHVLFSLGHFAKHNLLVEYSPQELQQLHAWIKQLPNHSATLQNINCALFGIMHLALANAFPKDSFIEIKVLDNYLKQLLSHHYRSQDVSKFIIVLEKLHQCGFLREIPAKWQTSLETMQKAAQFCKHSVSYKLEQS